MVFLCGFLRPALPSVHVTGWCRAFFYLLEGREINDLPGVRGNHDYIFGFLKPVCYAFGHLYGKREGISPEALMEECLHDVEQAAYHPHKALNRAIAQHLMQGDLQENLDSLKEDLP